MLNYIWAALIVLSFGFALWADLGDARTDRFRNGELFDVSAASPLEGEDLAKAVRRGTVPVTVTLNPDALSAHYPVFAEEYTQAKAAAEARGDDPPASPFAATELPATLLVTQDGAEVRFADNAPLPAPWREMDAFGREHMDAKVFRAELTSDEPWAVADEDAENLSAEVAGRTQAWLTQDTWSLEFTPVRLRKLKDIEAAAFWWADWAITFAIGLVGALCLWLGLVKIAEDAGLVYALVKVVRPLLGMIFPEVPKDHPAMGMIALNLSANVLGLGNAATPMGIKAMEELQKLNTTDDTATNSMCMFLAVNTASVQLVPPATLVAIMGVSTGQLWLPILVVTGLSLLIAISAAKALSLTPVYMKSDPMRQPPKTPSDATEEGGAA